MYGYVDRFFFLLLPLLGSVPGVKKVKCLFCVQISVGHWDVAQALASILLEVPGACARRVPMERGVSSLVG